MRVMDMFKLEIIGTGIVLLLFSCDLEKIHEEIPITFEKTFGGASYAYGRSVQQTQDGGYILTGSIGAVAGGVDVYLIKTDAFGDTTFTKTFGGAFDDDGWSVQQTQDGGYIITGATESKGAGKSDVYLIKTDAFGDTTFTKTFGGTFDDDGRSVQQTKDGGYIITGLTCSYGKGGCDAYLIKTDGDGELQFENFFGETGLEVGESVQQTKDGGYIITGYTTSFGSFGTGTLNFDVYLVKTNGSGDITFVNNFGDLLWEEIGYAVQQTLDGGYIITGSIEDLQGEGNDIYLIKTDSSGVSKFENSLGEADNDTGRSVQQTLDGGYIITGATTTSSEKGSNVYLVKTNANGDITFAKNFGGIKYDIGIAVQQTLDGGYIITGATTSFGTVNFELYLIKTDANGIVYQ